MLKKFSSSANKYPKDHPLRRIHHLRQDHFMGLRIVYFMLSAISVAICLVPSAKVRLIWSLILNVFTNHFHIYFYFLKQAYTLVINRVVIGILYFIALAPYALFKRILILRSYPRGIEKPENSDSESIRYQS